MRVAIIHDVLVEYGGAERVLQSFLRLYPTAHVYTAYKDEVMVREFFPPLNKNNLHCSPIQTLRLGKYGYLFQFLAPLIWGRLHLEQYDVVISSSAFWLSNTINVKHPVHIQYIHCPPKNLFNLCPKTKIQKLLPLTSILAWSYIKSLRRYQNIIVNSKHMQQTMRSICGVPSEVIYPPVIIPPHPALHNKGDYYIAVSRLDNTKGLELMISACNRMRAPLKIVGAGSDGRYIQHLYSLAGPTIEFTGRLSDKKIHHLYKNAIAFLFTPKEEDFGIAPLEAISYGVPVIAHYGGGAKETLKNRKTGLFFYSYTIEALVHTMQNLKPQQFIPTSLYDYAKQFHRERFEREMKHYIEGVIRR